MKKILALVLAMLMVLGTTAALADITVYGAATNTSEYVDQMRQGYEDQFGFAVNYENEPGYSDTVNMLTTCWPPAMTAWTSCGSTRSCS